MWILTTVGLCLSFLAGVYCARRFGFDAQQKILAARARIKRRLAEL
jgi:hypothetical protein